MPKLTDSYKEINKSIDILSKSGLGTAQSFADMASKWDGKYTIDKANELSDWMRANYATPDNLTQLGKAREKYYQPDDDVGGGWVSQRAGLINNHRDWVASDDYKALDKATKEYNATQPGKERLAYNTLANALFKEAEEEHGRKLDNGFGWVGQRADDFTDFMDKYNTEISMAILAMITAGVGSGVAAAAGGGMAGGAAGGAAAGAVNAHMTGGSFGDAMLGGALAGGIGGALQGTNIGASLGAETKTGQGLINGAIKGGLTTAAKGGNAWDGLVSGAISGGVSGYNPAGELGIDNKTASNIFNNAVAGLASGKSSDQVLSDAAVATFKGAATGKFVSLDEAKAWVSENLLPSAIESSIVAPSSGGNDDPGEGEGEGGDADGPTNQEGSSSMDDDILTWVNDSFGEGSSSNGSSGDDAYDGLWNQANENDAGQPGWTAPTDKEMDEWLKASKGSSWTDTAWKFLFGNGGVAGAVSGSGKSGSTAFSAGGLLGWLTDGINGKDVLGAIGSGVNSALIEKQNKANQEFQAAEAQKNRDFQKELQDRTWAQQEARELAARQRRAPVSGRPGLISSAISTIRSGGQV